MLRLALFFLIATIIFAIFGFGNVGAFPPGAAPRTVLIAKVIFFICMIIFVVLLVAGLMAGSTLW